MYCRDDEVCGAAEAAACSFPASFYHTINCRPAELSDFVLKAEDPEAKWAEVNVMKIGTFGTATTPVKRRVEVKDGVLDWESAGLSLAVVFERYKNGNVIWSITAVPRQRVSTAEQMRYRNWPKLSAAGVQFPGFFLTRSTAVRRSSPTLF